MAKCCCRSIGCPHKLGISTGEVRDELPFHTSRETIVITRMWNLYKMLIYLLLLLCPTSIRQGKWYQTSVNCTLFTGLRLFLWIKAGYRSHLLTRLFLDQLLCHRNHRCITSFWAGQHYGHPVLLSCGSYGNFKEHQMFSLKREGIVCDAVPPSLYEGKHSSSCLILKGSSNNIYVKTTLQ